MAIWYPNLSGRTGPKYLQIVEAMAEDIASGRLSAGARLPPHRELAYQLGISPNTTSRAYAEATKRALLRGEVGRGTFVRAREEDDGGSSPETLRREEMGPIDLSRNLPLPGLAEPQMRRTMSEIAGETGLRALLDYQTDADLWSHRVAGQTWLAGCGIETGVQNIVPVVGGQHGILSVLLAVLVSGDLLLVEALTYTPVLAMAARLNLQTGAVAMDADGILPEAFEAWCREANPKALYLTPTLQAPTTTTLSQERRLRIAEIADQFGVIVIEDDVFGPLLRKKPTPIAAMARETTVYVTSLSKAVAPGLRVGFLAAPARLTSLLHQSVNLSVWMTPPVTLEIARRLIEDGTAAKLAEQQSRVAIERQALAQVALGKEYLPLTSDGFHVWMHLPEGWRTDVFAAECRRQDVHISEGRSFAVNAGDAPEAIRICLSHEPNQERLQQGLDVVCRVLRQRPSASLIGL
ncbi:MAG: PLP-dependent aminotransferase family protein [Pseudomonadota bacterium]